METTEDKPLPLSETLELTSQRFIPQMADPLEAVEHYHRYLYASRFVRSKRVLDIACGEGYGSAFLSLNAQDVLGVDADGMAVAQARSKYASFPNARFETGRCEEFSVPEGSIDVVVSFDTLGLLEPEVRTQFMTNMKRALRPGGIALISAQERTARAVNEDGEPVAAGLSAREFSELVKLHFGSAIFVGQRPVTLSSIWSLYDWKDDHFRFHVREDLFTLPSDDELFAEPTDLIAICSDAHLPREIADSSKSFYYDTAQVKRTKDIFSRSRRLEQEVHDFHIEVETLRDEKQRQSAIISRLEGNILEHEQQAVTFQSVIDERDSRSTTLANDLASTHATIETLQQAYDLRTARANAVKEEHLAMTARVEQLQASLEDQLQNSWQKSEENQQLRAQVADLNVRHEESRARAIAAESELAAVQQEIRERASESSNNAEEVAMLNARIIHLENLSGEKSARTEKVNEELHKAIVHIEALHQEIEEVSAMGARAAEENAILRTKNRELIDNAETVVSTLCSLQAEREEILHQVHDLQMRVEEQSATLRNAAEEHAALRSRNEELIKNAETEVTTSGELEADREQILQQVHDLQKRVEEQSVFVRNAAEEQSNINAKMIEAQKVAAEKIHAADKLAKELAEARARIDELEFSNLSVEDQTNDLNDKIKEQTKFLMNLQREYEEQVRSARQNKVELEKQVAAFDTYQKTQADLQQRYNRSQIRVQELQATITVLEGKLAQITKSGTYKVLSNIGFVPKEKL